jgi:ppGpp synthetase/RelA/SpoT-type nucleotidyltranferase
MESLVGSARVAGAVIDGERAVARMSNSKVDALGDRLRSGELNADVLRLLAAYQAEFDPAYRYVERILTTKMLLKITGRPAKSTLSVIEKLRRIRSRLAQIQDIAGCRITFVSLAEQDSIIEMARQWFIEIEVDDKREMPVHGYRAVHLLVHFQGRCVEVQVRTRMQHFWATVSEKLSDAHGQEIKYGKGDTRVLALLARLSEQTARVDKLIGPLHRDRSAFDIAKSRKDKRLVKVLGKQIDAREAELRQLFYAINATTHRMDQLGQAHVLPD